MYSKRHTERLISYLCIPQTLEEGSHANETDIVVPHDSISQLFVAELILENCDKVKLDCLSSEEDVLKGALTLNAFSSRLFEKVLL